MYRNDWVVQSFTYFIISVRYKVSRLSMNEDWLHVHVSCNYWEERCWMLTDIRNMIVTLCIDSWGVPWKDTCRYVLLWTILMFWQLMLYRVQGSPHYRALVESFIRSYMPGGEVAQTPCGLAWQTAIGSLRYAGNDFKVFMSLVIWFYLFIC